MSVATITGYTAATIATGGTITVSYPAGTTRGDYVLGARHRLSVLGKSFAAPELITVALNATTAVVTYNGSTTIPAGSRYTVELDRNTDKNTLTTNQAVPDRFVATGLATYVYPVQDYALSLGTPTALSTTAVCATVAVAGAGAVAITSGTKYVAASANVPLGAPTGRAVQAVSSNAGDTTQTITVRGKDMYGQSMSATIALNGTTPVLGTKAFYSITSITASAALAGNLSVGDTDVLGLPVWLGNSTFVWRETQDGAVATAGTITAGLGQTLATAANGDVRGTYKPNAATDGTKSCILFAVIPEPGFYGQAQFTS